MNIKELRICLTDDISNPLALGENKIVQDIFPIAKEIVKQGGSIILEQCYENAPSEILARYSTEQEVDNWKNNLNNIQVVLKRNQIE